MVLTRQDDQASILAVVANAVGSLGPCHTEGIFLDGRWQPVQVPAREAGPVSLPGVLPTADGHPAAAGGALVLGGVAWSWAYSLAGPHGPAGYLVVGAEGRPAESERFLLRVLAQQTGLVLANARLHHGSGNGPASCWPLTGRCCAAWRFTTGSPGWRPAARGSWASPGRSTS
jgi:hypothetical protein